MGSDQLGWVREIELLEVELTVVALFAPHRRSSLLSLLETLTFLMFL